MDAVTVYADADAAALYDVLNPRASPRFLDVPALGAFLVGTGLAIEAQYGDWHRGPVTDASREIITIARRIQPLRLDAGSAKSSTARGRGYGETPKTARSGNRRAG